MHHRPWLARGLSLLVTALLLAALTGAADPPVAHADGGAASWYFAEGYTGDGFDTYLTMLNPNPTAAPVTITYYLGGGRAPVVKSLTIAAQARATVAVHETALGVGRNQEVAARVTTTNPGGIVVERPIYFRYGGAITGGHVVLGVTAPRASWYFAEGYTGAGFDQYLTILNPNPSPAPVTISYFLANGAPVTKQVTVAASARRTVAVHETAEGVGRGQAVAARVETTNPGGIVVERPMYFIYGAGIDGGHVVMGTAAPRATWLFAEGYTGDGFDQYLTMLNASAAPAPTTITYYLADGTTRTRTLTVAGNSRATVAVHEAALGVGRGQAVSTRVETSSPGGIVVERPMYFRYAGGITDGHVVMGAERPAGAWLFAEGYTGDGFDEYLTILNPNAGAVPVAITYYLADGTTRLRSLTVAGTRRATVAVHDATQGVGRGQAVAARVETTNPGGIVVERPIYFTYGAGIDGGHVALGFSAAPTGDPYAAAILADRPAGYWRLGELGGTTAAAAAGAPDGSYAGGVTLGQAGAIAGNPAPLFNNGKVGFGDVYDFAGAAPFTLEAWVYPTGPIDAGAYRRVISKETLLGVAATGGQGYSLSHHDTLGLVCGRYAGPAATEASSPTPLARDAWNHLACTFDGTTLRLYRNGVEVATNADPAVLLNTSQPLTVGQLSTSTGGSYVQGRIDEVAIYTAALPAARVAAHYQAAR